MLLRRGKPAHVAPGCPRRARRDVVPGWRTESSCASDHSHVVPLDEPPHPDARSAQIGKHLLGIFRLILQPVGGGENDLRALDQPVWQRAGVGQAEELGFFIAAEQDWGDGATTRYGRSPAEEVPIIASLTYGTFH